MNTDAANRRKEGFAHDLSEVHGHVGFTPPEQMVRALCSSVPVELLTYIMGQSESTVHRWACGDVADVTDTTRESERRLAAAYEILQPVDRFDAPGVAATWFTCNDPQLDFVMPATALREGLLEETLAAARHLSPSADACSWSWPATTMPLRADGGRSRQGERRP